MIINNSDFFFNIPIYDDLVQTQNQRPFLLVIHEKLIKMKVEHDQVKSEHIWQNLRKN